MDSEPSHAFTFGDVLICAFAVLALWLLEKL